MENEKLSVKLYRHKVYKDFYVIRTNLCGGSEKSPFYEITKDLQKAINSVLDYNNQKNETFEKWMDRFKDENGVTELQVKTVFKKEIEFDGYKGVLEKKVVLPVSEFELVELKEESNG